MASSPMIAVTENSEVHYYNKEEVIKKMKFNGATAREVSLRKALQKCPVVLGSRKEIVEKNKIGLIYPLTKDFELPENTKNNYESLFKKCIYILAVLEKGGIAHLDFLPSNLCYHDGKLLVRDFGNSYIFSDRQGFLHTGRYPRIQIRAPEFIEFPERPDDDVDSKNRILGSFFDQRADIWSLACWMYMWLEGVWPVNDINDYYLISSKHLFLKYGKIGSYIDEILTNPDRPWPSQICQEMSISIPSFELNLPLIPFFHPQIQETSTLDSDYPQIEIADQLVWILSAAQRLNVVATVKEIIPLFLDDEDWMPETIELFKKLDFQLYTENLLRTFVGFVFKEQYYDLLRSPGDFQDSNVANQMQKILQEKQLSNYTV